MKLFAPLLASMLVAFLVGCDKGAQQGEPPAAKTPPATADTSLAAAPQTAEEAKHTAQVQADMKTVMQATAAADVKTLLSYTHPKVIEIAGGEETFAGVLQGGLAAMKESGVTFGDLSFPAPPKFIQTELRLYAVIPQKISMTVPAGGIETTSFQLGVLENGSTSWKYLDVSKFDRQMLKEWFPDFPEDYTFPEVSMKQL